MYIEEYINQGFTVCNIRYSCERAWKTEFDKWTVLACPHKLPAVPRPPARSQYCCCEMDRRGPQTPKGTHTHIHTWACLEGTGRCCWRCKCGKCNYVLEWLVERVVKSMRGGPYDLSCSAFELRPAAPTTRVILQQFGSFKLHTYLIAGTDHRSQTWIRKNMLRDERLIGGDVDCIHEPWYHLENMFRTMAIFVMVWP